MAAELTETSAELGRDSEAAARELAILQASSNTWERRAAALQEELALVKAEAEAGDAEWRAKVDAAKAEARAVMRSLQEEMASKQEELAAELASRVSEIGELRAELTSKASEIDELTAELIRAKLSHAEMYERAAIASHSARIGAPAAALAPLSDLDLT